MKIAKNKRLGWIRIEDQTPLLEQRILVAKLNRYGNARWRWSRDAGVYAYSSAHGKSCWHPYEPDYWMPFPDSPEMTKKEKEESEECGKTEKARKILELQEKIQELMMDPGEEDE